MVNIPKPLTPEQLLQQTKQHSVGNDGFGTVRSHESAQAKGTFHNVLKAAQGGPAAQSSLGQAHSVEQQILTMSKSWVSPELTKIYGQDVRWDQRPSTYKDCTSIDQFARGVSVSYGERGNAVQYVQTQLLKAGFDPGPLDGRFGPLTERALHQFQQSKGIPSTSSFSIKSLNNADQSAWQTVQSWRQETGWVPMTAADAPNPNTPGYVSAESIRAISKGGLNSDQAEVLSSHLNYAMKEAGIKSPTQKAAFLAQLSHESGGFRHFTELGSGAAYEGRLDLGNEQPGDGQRFKGRGLIQLTGRTNYERASEALGVDFVKNPELAAQPGYAARIAGWFWKTHGCNPLAEAGDFMAVTKRINGGYNGLSDRQERLVVVTEILHSQNRAKPS